MQNHYDKNNPLTIQNLFNSIAPKYDKGNALLSFGLYKLWNHKLAQNALLDNPSVILDLCCGTGAIGKDILKLRQKKDYPKNLKLHCLDFSPNMLRIAQQTLNGAKKEEVLVFHEADAQAVPIKSASIDTITMAYGIRNIPHTQKTLTEMFRLLKPQGRLCMIELTRPSHPFLSFAHNIHLQFIIPFVGKVFARNEEAYRYLMQSIQQFLSVQELKNGIKTAGFANISALPLCGGICTLFTAIKPL